MGVNFSDLVETRAIDFEDMRGKKLAVDAFNTMYQFVSIIRQRDGTPLKDSKGRITSHLSGLFYRTTKWFEYGMRPVFVFDGKPPELKAKESAERRKRRKKAKQEYERLKEEGKMKEAYVKATQSAKLSEEMIVEAKKLLGAMGVPVVQAPSEGEAQSAWMVNNDRVWASASQDWDSLLFGAKRMVKNLAVSGKRKVPGKNEYRKITPELIALEDVLDALALSREQLIWMALLMGTDFNPKGIHGYGPKKSLKLVKQCESFEDVLDEVAWEHENDPHEILQFFLHPPVNQEIDMSFSEPDTDAIRTLLVEEHEFSEKRIGNGLERLREASASWQAGLGSFT